MTLVTSGAGFIGADSASQLARSLTENHEIYVIDCLNNTAISTNLGPVSNLDRVDFNPVNIGNLVAVGPFMAKIGKVFRDSPNVVCEIGFRETIKCYRPVNHWSDPLLANSAAEK